MGEASLTTPFKLAERPEAVLSPALEETIMGRDCIASTLKKLFERSELGGMIAAVEHGEPATCEIDKDKLIEELKAALVRRELRINELELALYYARNGAASSEVGLASGPCALDTGTSTGVYGDGWIADETTLAFGAGGEIALTFFLPPIDGRGGKRLQIEANFGESTILNIERGIGVDYHLVIPPEINRPVISIRCEYPEPVADDRRLGVIIVQ